MKQIPFIFLTLIISLTISCQSKKNSSDFNFDFEKVENNFPSNWDSAAISGGRVYLDSIIKKSGKFSAAIECNGTSSSSGVWGYIIHNSYEGKKITLSGFIKTENVTDGFAGLWMRIDPNVAFNNMYDKGIKGTADWKKYEITLDMNPNKTKQIVVGGLLYGKGKIWIDDLNVSIDGKDISELTPLPKEELPADKDKEFDDGSKITSVHLTGTKTDDLVLLGKVWGFLKNYHPAIAKGNFNWDYELFRVLPKILGTKNKIGRNNVLSEWINGLGKIDKGKENGVYGQVKIPQDLAWMNNADLGDSLMAQLTVIKNAARTPSDNYYIGLEDVGSPIFKNERSYANMKYPDAGFRLLCLYRYWNFIQYYYPYKNLIDENWNDVLKEFVPKFINAQDELGYKQTVLSLIVRIHDTLANIYGPDEALKNWRGANYAPVEIRFAENKAVVTGYYDKESGEKSGLKIGDVIEKINNKPVEEIIKERLPFTPGSNYPTQLREIADFLLRTNDSLLTVTYREGESELTKQINCYSSNKINIYNKNQISDTCFKMINSDIAYIYPGNIKNEYLPVIMPEVLKTKGLIIDMRCYPSDFVVYTLSKYLLPEKTFFVKFSNGSITYPGIFTMANMLSVGDENKDFYKGKVVIIVNEQTQSQAEFTTMGFKTAPNATVIGSTTAGADGNVSKIILPGGISTMISGIGVYYPDGKETQRIGIVPDIVVKPTIKGITAGKDELLDKAIEIINSK